MSGLQYPWQQAVADAFAASRESLPIKINIAQKAIAARRQDSPEPDVFERIAIFEALRALRSLIDETTPKSSHPIHYHIRWVSGALDWERFSTSLEAEASAQQLARPGETYRIEQYDEQCGQCRALAKGQKTTPA